MLLVRHRAASQERIVHEARQRGQGEILARLLLVEGLNSAIKSRHPVHVRSRRLGCSHILRRALVCC